MADKYGSYYNNGSYDVFRAAIRYETTTTDTTVTVRCRSWIAMGDGHDSGSNFAGRAYVTDEYSSWVYGSGYLNAGDESGWLGDITKTFTRTHSDQTVTCSGQGWSSTWDAYTPWVNAYVTVPKRASYTVTYSANGGSGAPSQQTKWHGETLTLSSTKPTRTGYTFKGWATSSSATTATYQPGDPYTGNAALSLYAVWQVITYKVTFNANGGSGAPSAQTKTHGVALSLNGWGSTSTTDAPTRTGYTFLGWATSSSATSATYTSSSHSYTANAAVTLYAVWQAVTYTVSYNANQGSGAPSSQTKTYGVALTLRTGVPTRSGYAFKGWATSASGSVAYAAGGSYTANASVTLYAVWQAQAPTLTVTKAYRANSTDAADDEGTYVHVVAKWTQAVSGSVTVTASLESGGSTRRESTTVTDTSGTADLLIDTGDTLDGGTAYTVTVTATNSAGTTTKTYRLGTAAWPIDVLAGGNGVAIGKAATQADTLDVAWPIQAAGDIRTDGVLRAHGGDATLTGNASYIYLSETGTNLFRLNKSTGAIQRYNGSSWDGLVWLATTSRTANTVLAAPNGSDGTSAFRALVAADIPSLAASKIASGTFDAARIPSLAASKITSGTFDSARIPAPTWTELGRVSGTNSATISISGYAWLALVAYYSTTYWSALYLKPSWVTTTSRDWYFGGWTRQVETPYAAACALTTTKLTGYQGYAGSTTARNITYVLYGVKW